MKRSSQAGSESYRKAGVDIDLAEGLLDKVKEKIARATRPELLNPIGGFGGMFAIDLEQFRHPVMVTSIDGVGTKLMVASMMGRHGSVGYDIVNHCINDIAVQGAEPVYFTDYIGIGKLRSPLYEEVVAGIADACAAQNVALIGGETAEMPGMYGDDYDLVGCITGIVERDRIITGERVEAGHAVIGLASSGLHTNGYSLARRVLFEQSGYEVSTVIPEIGIPLGGALLEPHTCYWPAIRSALDDNVPIDAIAHITGGGIYGNVPRVLPEGAGIVCDVDVMHVPPVFRVIEQEGQVDIFEMYRVFNMGIGMVWLVPPGGVNAALEHCSETGFEAAVIGEVVASDEPVKLRGLES